jgi:hypothetical protein
MCFAVGGEPFVSESFSSEHVSGHETRGELLLSLKKIAQRQKF